MLPGVRSIQDEMTGAADAVAGYLHVVLNVIWSLSGTMDRRAKLGVSPGHGEDASVSGGDSTEVVIGCDPASTGEGPSHGLR